MVDLGDQGENLPADGGALVAHGAPFANPPAPQTTHQESGVPSSATSLTMTEFASFMESFKSSMENSMKALFVKKSIRNLHLFHKLPPPHQHFFQTPLWMLME